MCIRIIISKAYQAFLENNTELKPKVHQECKSILSQLSNSQKKDIRLIIQLSSVLLWCEDWNAAWELQRIFFEDLDNCKEYFNEIEDYLYLCFIIDINDELELFSYYGWLESYFENAYDALKCFNGKYPEYYYEDDFERIASIKRFSYLQKKYSIH